MKEKVKQLLIYTILRALFYFFRICRGIKRALIHGIKFIPVLLITTLVVVVVYFIGVEFNWYTEGFIAALKDLKSFLISILITSYFVTFLNSERQRKIDLRSQYAIRYYILTTTAEFLIAIKFAFDIDTTGLTPTATDGDNEDNFNKIIDIIKSIDFENINVNWEKCISRGGGCSLETFFNSTTHELINVIRDSCRERHDGLIDVKRQIYEKYTSIRMKFNPTDAFKWDKVEKTEMKDSIIYILDFVKEIDRIVCEPWAVNPRLKIASESLYERFIFHN